MSSPLDRRRSTQWEGNAFKRGTSQGQLDNWGEMTAFVMTPAYHSFDGMVFFSSAVLKKNYN